MTLITRPAGGTIATVKEADGTPSVSNVRTLIVSNGTLTDNTGGSVNLTTGGGGGGGGATFAETFNPGLIANSVAINQIMLLCAIIPNDAMTVTTLEAYLATIGGATNVVELGIYDSTDTLLSSGTASLSAAGLFTVTLAVAQALTARTRYRLAVLDRNNNAGTTIGTQFGLTNDASLAAKLTGQATMPASSATAAANQDIPWIRAY